jgi:hypothetical protein
MTGENIMTDETMVHAFQSALRAGTLTFVDINNYMRFIVFRRFGWAKNMLLGVERNGVTTLDSSSFTPMEIAIATSMGFKV